MSDLVKIWAPILKQNDEPTMSLAVPYRWDTPPNEEQYRNLLELRLNALIKADPKQALRDLEAVSTPEYPGLYPELRWHPPDQWTFLIMLSFEMRMLLCRIDWQKNSTVQEVSIEELPSFMDVLQMM